MRRRNILLLTAGVSLFVFFGVFGAHAQTASSGDTIGALEHAIQEIEVQITALQTRLGEARGALQRAKETPATPVLTTTSTNIQAELFTRPIALGTRGDDVKELQKFLSQFPDLYPEQLQTGFYGPRTAAAVRKFQERHNIESVGSVGPKTLAKISELVTTGAGKSGVVPPGLITASGIQKQLTATTTVSIATSTCATNYSLCYAKSDCESAKFFWYTVSCHPNPAPTYSCAESYSYCINPTECSKNGWYWCRNSCYGVVEACLGQTYTPPAVSAPPPTSSSSASTASATTTSSIAPTATTTTSATTTATTSNTSTATSTIVSTADKTPPTTPTGLSVTASSSTQMYLSWNASTDNVGVTEYMVYRDGGYENSVYATSGSTVSLSYVDTRSLSSGTTYTYTVAAVDTARNTSPRSSPVSATTQSVSATVPVTPSTLTYSRSSNNATVTLSWSDSSANETRFEILKRINGSFAFIGQVGTNATTFSDTPPAGTYDYTVRACNEVGCSNSPSQITVVVGASTGDTTAPSIPTSVRLSSPLPGYSSVNLYWNASTDNVSVAGYKVYQNGIFLIDTGGAFNNTEVDNLSNGYSYSVAAYDGAGNLSAQSSSASASPTATTTSFRVRKENLAAISEVVGSLNAALDALIQLLKRF